MEDYAGTVDFYYMDKSKSTFPINHSFKYLVKKGRFNHDRPIKIVAPLRVLHDPYLCKYLYYYLHPVKGVILFK